jgi:hypothetical protein
MRCPGYDWAGEDQRGRQVKISEPGRETIGKGGG